MAVAEMVIKPKNWSDFQHYKDRSPKWIKLHRGLLDDFEFHCLPLASRALAPMFWLLASEHENGEIVCNWQKLAFRLRCQADEIEEAAKHLIAGGFFIVEQDASNVLAEAERGASLEKSKSREEEEKKESGARAPSGGKPPADDYTPEFEKVWAEYPKRAGANPKRRAFKAWTARLKDGEEPSEILAGVIRYAEFLKSTRKLNTEFVQQAATFFGPDRHYLEPWACPGAGQAKQFSETNYQEGIGDDGRLQ